VGKTYKKTPNFTKKLEKAEAAMKKGKEKCGY